MAQPAVPLGVAPQLKPCQPARGPQPPSPCRPPLTECLHSNYRCLRYHDFSDTPRPPQPTVPALNQGSSAEAKDALSQPLPFRVHRSPRHHSRLRTHAPFPSTPVFYLAQHCFSPAPAPPGTRWRPTSRVRRAPLCCCTRHVAFCLKFVSPSLPLPLIPPALPMPSRALGLPPSLFPRAAGCELIAHAVLQPPAFAPGRPAIAGQYPAFALHASTSAFLASPCLSPHQLKSLSLSGLRTSVQAQHLRYRMSLLPF